MELKNRVVLFFCNVFYTIYYENINTKFAIPEYIGCPQVQTEYA
jgi:hypothetical protein